MKLWNSSQEWYQYIQCGGDIRFIKDPNELSGKDIKEVQAICAQCPVRPECLKANCVDRQEATVWVAGEWIPEMPGKTKNAKNRRALFYAGMADRIPEEEANRPDFIR
ncbi:WhiB family transcriptional regulator [Mycobacteroides abscessus]|uniref:WhiB family transcriptional regulator n=1 Tax=Mycobacteroides abscessus TaxID=36809 RepID=UPI0009A68BF8|nr:WhiB family transcriptional regulator [Mycobacteroides abscessus]SKK36833.1 Uncharacterised protein [Mycobacteroides abscessus subsp. massiliense]SKM34912.1 Uncharacterised protein [Mycobacteroides abscessus subsp. massiliense]SKP08702.1 Uncharacterised protein [Mycobacteroides abscessus subsp. massiliense]SKP94498.1 Uncharacterised protein [Mycobacteroides abscessus subsp. massiliense]SLK59688.1 Uncharacterised protein [Mycobacteroides abscessus subsp. massiliense]